MLKKLLVLAIGLVVAAGCGTVSVISNLSSDGNQVRGSGKVTTVTRPVGSFKSVQLDGSLDADITVGKQTALKISGDDNIVPLVKTEIRGDTLRIYVDGSYSTHNPLKISFAMPELKAAALNGSGDLAIHAFRGKELKLELKGSGDLMAEGSADTLFTSIMGSGDLHLFRLPARNVHISIHGSGDAEVNASSSLEAAIAGSGDISYKGRPKSVKPAIAGSGDIHAVD
jgi:hypothetical protein